MHGIEFSKRKYRFLSTAVLHKACYYLQWNCHPSINDCDFFKLNFLPPTKEGGNFSSRVCLSVQINLNTVSQKPNFWHIELHHTRTKFKYQGLWVTLKVTRIKRSIMTAFGYNHSGQSKVVGNEGLVTKERLLHWVPSLFWARFGGWG